MSYSQYLCQARPHAAFTRTSTGCKLYVYVQQKAHPEQQYVHPEHGPTILNIDGGSYASAGFGKRSGVNLEGEGHLPQL